ncbi:MAG: winged helix-turn-helix domain-containing protein [Nanoarchaeota archaeon]
MKSAKQKERELIIKLGNEKKTVREIASILGISKSKASFWINRYNKTKNLADEPRSGRPTPLARDKLDSITKLIKSRVLEPKRAGISSKEVLQLIEHKTKRHYTLRHAQRLLHKMGFSLITPRVSHIRKDEKAQAKFREEFKKNSNWNIWAIQ